MSYSCAQCGLCVLVTRVSHANMDELIEKLFCGKGGRLEQAQVQCTSWSPLANTIE